ncbi:heavy-metal-associated domain-containing protein [Halanaeroarchaeum sulfurireducens]|uniref:Heavy metal transport/detoxification protein n=1 Tax=Halanaeroarchaeum sulfurireducens TaxID=1604004 RepID=A0A0F7PAF4_9EURY|nr:cation transporter [Halanaeroarchaeum sulfurireducens]AKH97702.1 heavy metal transport/detoxification protein [Halanaeroarchaeum sulfurireducens]ALG82097.1 heavy metal transport/detoxification protein [Halanaeroarchaeum sulfurireducens]
MSITVTVSDMSCDGCEEIVENAVSEVNGVESVEADSDAETVTVEGSDDVEAIMEAIDFAGYSPSRESTEGDEEDADTTGADEDEA